MAGYECMQRIYTGYDKEEKDDCYKHLYDHVKTE